MEKEKSLKLISVVLLAATLLTFFSWSVDFAHSDVFTGMRYSPESSSAGGDISSLTPLPCREARIVRDSLCEAIVRNDDIYVRSNCIDSFTALVIFVLLSLMIKTAQIIGIRKYRLLI